MILSKLKASMAVAAISLVSYSPLWAQEVIRDGCFPNCVDGGGGNDVPELDGPGVLMLVAVGIVAAVAIAKRK